MFDIKINLNINKSYKMSEACKIIDKYDDGFSRLYMTQKMLVWLLKKYLKVYLK